MAKDLTKSKGRQELAVISPPTETVEVPLPLLEALEDVEHAFVGVCIDAGEAVLAAMMEHDRTVLCGPAWKPDANRRGRRAGSTASPITLGGRRLVVRRPRARTKRGEELALPSYAAAANEDPLDRHTLEALAAGVSTRRYERTLDRVPAERKERATSKSAVSRRFVALTERAATSASTPPTHTHRLRPGAGVSGAGVSRGAESRASTMASPRLVKNSAASFRDVAVIIRWPTWASLPPTVALAS